MFPSSIPQIRGVRGERLSGTHFIPDLLSAESTGGFFHKIHPTNYSSWECFILHKNNFVNLFSYGLSGEANPRVGIQKYDWGAGQKSPCRPVSPGFTGRFVRQACRNGHSDHPDEPVKNREPFAVRHGLRGRGAGQGIESVRGVVVRGEMMYREHPAPSISAGSILLHRSWELEAPATLHFAGVGKWQRAQTRHPAPRKS